MFESEPFFTKHEKNVKKIVLVSIVLVERFVPRNGMAMRGAKQAPIYKK